MECTTAVIDSIILSSISLSEPEGRTKNLTASATKSDNSTEAITLTGTYGIDNSSIISVNNGILSFDNEGNSNLKISKDGIDSNSLNIIVTAKIVDSVVLTPDSTTAVHGEIVTFTNKATWSNGDITDIVQTATYQISGTGTGNITDDKIKLSTPGSLIVNSNYNSVNSNQITITINPYFKEFIATNISSSSCTMVIITHEVENDISISYGTSEPFSNMSKSENSKFTIMNLTTLTTETKYDYYMSGGTGDTIAIDNNLGNYYSFTTSKVGIGNSYILAGKFMNGVTPINNGIIIIKKNGIPLMTKSDSNGNWFVNLANLKNNDGTAETFTAGDTMTIRYLSPDGSDNSGTYNLSGSSPDSVN
jgi:ABC-type uncharacterized transport system YnjBCD ATPase subunit